MQMDLFFVPEQRPAVQLCEHPSAGYAPRTWENARRADVTVAFAVDYTTAGERLTHRAAGERYIAIPFGGDAPAAAIHLAQFLAQRGATTLNVAGNGLATLVRHKVTQAQANRWVYEVLRRVHARRPLAHIRSGGQTGIDTSGLVAGIALGVPVTGLFPKGYRQRLANQQDVLRDPATLEAELYREADALRFHTQENQ